MAIGNPITLTSNVASKTISVIATAGQTLFTVTGGYRINQLAVFRNGVRLLDSRDYEARNGATVTLLSAATVGDALEFQVFDDFRVADAIVSAESEQTISGNLTVSGILTATDLRGSDVTFRHVKATGISTVSDTTQTTSTTTGALVVSGGVGIAKSLFVGGDMQVAGTLSYEDVTNTETAGITTTGGLVVTGLGATFGSGVGIADSIYHIGDSNTAIRFPAADTFTVTTAGNEAIRVSAGGSFGIGTNNPDRMLSVSDTTNGKLARFIGPSNNLFIMNDRSGIIDLNSSGTGDHLCLGTQDTERVRIKSDGDVGIGTDDPTEKLHVFNRTSNGGLIHYDGASNSHFGLRIRSNSDGGNFESDFANGTTAMLDLFADASTVSGGDFLVCRSQDANPILLVKGNGNIGVNTATPTSVFDVQVDTLAGINFTNQGQGPILDFRANNVESAGRIRVGENSGGAEMLFHTKTTGGTITESFRVDTSQRVIIGSGQNVNNDQLQVNNSGGSNIGVSRFSDNGGGPDLFLIKSRNATPGNHTAVTDGDVLGQIRFRGDDGSDYVEGCRLFAEVNGTVSTNTVNTDLVFGSGTTGTERVRVTSAGRIGIGTDNPDFKLHSNETGGSSIAGLFETNQTDAFISFQASGTTASSTVRIGAVGDDFQAFINGAERLRIDSNGNFIFKNGALIENGFHDDGGGLTGDYNHDLGTYGNVHFAATNAAGAFTYNLRINSSTTLNSVMAEGDVLSFTLMHATNNASNYLTQLKIDGSNVSPVWAGGSAPSAATGSGFDVYSFSIMKTGNNTYGIFGSLTNHA